MVSSNTYQRQTGGNGIGKKSHSARELTEEQERVQRRQALKIKRRIEYEAFDERNGFHRFCHFQNDVSSSKQRKMMKMANSSGTSGTAATTKRGWVFNLLPTVSPSTAKYSMLNT